MNVLVSQWPHRADWYVEVRMQPEIKLLAPDECMECGFQPARKNSDNKEVAVEHTFIEWAMPGAVVAFYICPTCGCIMPNKNFLENVKALQEFKKAMIVKPRNILPISGRC